MRLHYFPKKDILKSPAQLVCLPMNSVGVAGAGLAKQFATQFPDHLKLYKEFCFKGMLKPGGTQIIGYDLQLEKMYAQDSFFVFTATKQSWRDPSRLEWIQSILEELADYIEDGAFTSIAIPPLGCGLGGLLWKDVHALILKVLSKFDVDVIIYGESAPNV